MARKETDLKAGDVVMLASESAKMTVSGFEKSTGKALCIWFDGSGMHEHAIFPEALIKQPPAAPKPEVLLP